MMYLSSLGGTFFFFNYLAYYRRVVERQRKKIIDDFGGILVLVVWLYLGTLGTKVRLPYLGSLTADALPGCDSW